MLHLRPSFNPVSKYPLQNIKPPFIFMDFFMFLQIHFVILNARALFSFLFLEGHLMCSEMHRSYTYREINFGKYMPPCSTYLCQKRKHFHKPRKFLHELPQSVESEAPAVLPAIIRVSFTCWGKSPRWNHTGHHLPRLPALT